MTDLADDLALITGELWTPELTTMIRAISRVLASDHEMTPEFRSTLLRKAVACELEAFAVLLERTAP